MDHYEMESSIEKVSIHPDYKPGKVNYDIAVIKISTAEFGNTIRPICIGKAYDVAGRSDGRGIVSSIKDSSVKTKHTTFFRPE